MSDWQSIETAPRDHAIIIAAPMERANVWEVSLAKWVEHPSGEVGWFTERGNRSHVTDPTYWCELDALMRAPTPPTQEHSNE